MEGVPLELPVIGVELALLEGAMLAGEGSIGGVFWEPLGCWPEDAAEVNSDFSASRLRATISDLILDHERSKSGSVIVLAM